MSTPQLAAALRLMPSYGKTELPESAPILTATRMRKWKEARERFSYRTSNRLNDPLTYFLIVRWLLQIQPWEPFNSKSLAHALNQYETAFSWDAVTVGRILNDLIESAEMANEGEEFQPIRVTRRSTGHRYETSHHPAARAVLANLLDDLVMLGNRAVEDDRAGIEWNRQNSILARCPSLFYRPEAA